MTFSGFLTVAGILRLIPVLLFLLQYRGRWRSPVAWMLRGWALTAAFRPIITFLLAVQNPSVLSASYSPWLLRLSIIETLGTTLLAWLLYGIFLKYRKT